MKNISNKWFSRGALIVATLVGFAACTDDHFDVQTGNGGSNGLTIWQNIASNGNLDSLAMILQRAKVMKSETDRNATLTLAKLLDEPQSFTFWAPKDGTYNAKQYLDMLDEADELRAQGTDEALRQAMTLEYKVSNQFAYNHLARFNYESTNALQEVRLLNSKRADYDASKQTFNNVALAGENIHGTNGSLHVLNGCSPFAYNIYEYLSTDPNLSSINAYIMDPSIDKEEFSETLSTPGAMNENGEMVYVDSIYQHTNELLDYSGASVTNEDSTYIVLMPTNTAWEQAIEKLRPLFNYGTSYKYDWSTSRKDFASTVTLNADSLTDYRIRESLVTSMFFSPSIWHDVDVTDSAAVNYYATHADSLTSTNGVVYYNPDAVEGEEHAGLNRNFDGKQPIKASNGYIYCVDNYNVENAYTWLAESDIDATSTYNIASTTNTLYRTGLTVVLSDKNRNPDVTGDVENNTYQIFEASERSDMTVEFMLSDVLSGAYRIKIVMVPSKINLDILDVENEVCTFTAEIYGDDGRRVNKASDAITIDQDKVKEYVLWDKFEFPKCYYSLPTGYDSFPRLRLTLKARDMWNRNEKICTALNIVKVILEPYKE